MSESETKLKRFSFAACPEILNPKSKVNTLYPVTVQSAMFSVQTVLSMNPDTFPPDILVLAFKVHLNPSIFIR